MWPLQRLRSERPELRSCPVVLHSDHGGHGPKVALSSRWPMQRGVVPGMPLAEAEALLEHGNNGTSQRNSPPPTHFEPWDEHADRSALIRLASTGERFTPLFGLEDSEHPECLLFDVTGSTHLFGEEQGTVDAVEADFLRLGFRAHVAMSSTVGAAWAASHFLAQPKRARVLVMSDIALALAPLPISALRLPGSTISVLHELGVQRIGQLEKFPRESLPSRFGPSLLQRLDQALGRQEELFASLRPQEPVKAEWAGEFPVSDRESLTFVCGELLQPLLGRLQAQRLGLRRLRVSVCGPGGASAELLVGFVSPTDSHSHVLEMLRLRFERAALPDEVLFVRLEAVATSSLEIRQRDLFGEDSEQHHREVFSLVDRLSNRLGANAVLRAECVPERVPEETAVYQPWLAASEKTRTGSVMACAAWPLRMLQQPEDIQVFRSGSEGAPLSFHWNHHEHRVIRSWGPERIETTWWSESPVLRDYFRVEDQSGCQFWLFCRLDSRRWFIHGTFE